MGKVTYREYREEDFEGVKRLFKEIWKIDTYIHNRQTLDKVLGIYVSSCILGSTFGKVAVINNTVVGVILGERKGDKKIRFSFEKMLNAFNNILQILLFKRGDDKKVIKEYMKIFKSYNQLIRGRDKDFDGSVVFLALDKECQGKGIGKSLMNYLLDYMKERKTESIYVYTDTECNYRFYDSQGFQLVDNREITFTNRGQINDVDIFLYKYNF